MVTKQKHFLDSLRQMVSKPGSSTCPTCQKEYEDDICPDCQITGTPSEHNSDPKTTTAYLVDLVSNHKIRVPSPLCKVGRDESNDIVVSGDQSISRHHLSITYDGNQYHLEDGNSRHGTFLNGTQIKNKEAISDGDVVKIGVSLFWFVIENSIGKGDSDSSTLGQMDQPAEPAHLTVKSDILTEPSDPSASTMNDIPVMPNEQSLMDRLRLKTRSFDQSGLFAHAQSQPGKIGTQGFPDLNKSGSDTQAVLPALDESGGHQAYTPNSLSLAPPEPVLKETQSHPSHNVQNQVPAPTLSGDSSVYDQLMNADLAELIDKYNQLKHKIDEAQKHMEQIANQLNAIKALGTNLIGGSGNALVDACNKVFSQLGWQIAPNKQDPQELLLTQDGQLSIARVIWTAEEPERSHLGQLSISQTHHWCEQGQEPKGILIISRLNDNGLKTPNLTHADYESELTKYAAKKNVCMMTSLQVLAIYRDLILKNADIRTLREKIMSTNGWLDGFAIKSSQ